MTEKKKSTDELYADKQWSDNLSFSRKAIDESKKKTGQIDTPAPKPAPPRNVRPIGGPLDKYVNEMNREINRVSDAVGERIDSAGKGLGQTVKRMVKPVGKNLGDVTEAAASGLKNMSTGIGKAMLQEFTSVIRNVGDKVSVKGAQGEAPAVEVAQIEEAEAAPAISVRSFTTHFGTLLEQKVFFSTIHGRPFLTERDIEVYRPGDAQQAYEWMTRGIDEIRNCAPYGQKLPTPKKGPFSHMPMYDILRDINYDQMEQFLTFCQNRPQPFQQKALKLSEAFATWVHKGAPER